MLRTGSSLEEKLFLLSKVLLHDLDRKCVMSVSSHFLLISAISQGECDLLANLESQVPLNGIEVASESQNIADVCGVPYCIDLA